MTKQINQLLKKKQQIVCKTNTINTLTKGKTYDVIDGSWYDASFLIMDDFENKQWYFHDHFYTIPDLREEKLNNLGIT